MEQARIRAADAVKQVRRQQVHNKAISFFNAGNMDVIVKNKDAVLAFIQLLEKDDVAYASLQSLRKCKDGSTYASKLVEDLLRSQMKLSDIGEEMLLPKLLAALSRPVSNFNDWPVMIQTMYDFAMVMSAKDPMQSCIVQTESSQACAAMTQRVGIPVATPGMHSGLLVWSKPLASKGVTCWRSFLLST